MNNHYRLCFDPARPDIENKTPSWPLIVITRDGHMYDAATIRGAVASIVGAEYLDAQDETDDWILRVQHARREAMLGTMADLQIKIIDDIKGVIPDNFTASADDPEYALDLNQPITTLNVTSERSYLFTLAAYGAIRLMQRSDATLLQDLSNDGNNPELVEEIRGLEFIEYPAAELMALLAL